MTKLYQDFFTSEKRDYYKLPKVADALSNLLAQKYQFLSEKDFKKIYHPSMIAFYAPAKEIKIEGGRYLKLLGSPVIGAWKNPMAMRVLHTLRKQINALLKTTDKDGNCLIDEDTRIVVETARELNDANMRWAIEAYQKEREKENKEYKRILKEDLKEHFPNRPISDTDIDFARLTCEQHDIPENGNEYSAPNNIDTDNKKYNKDITKYKLWLEQGCRCLYTGKVINITNLFDDNAFDIEHTIPRSQSFDDSLANLTICDAHFNRTIKKNQIPTQLANYEEISSRLQPWKDKVEKLKDNVAYWKAQSKRAQDKNRKDNCIRQKHLWQMELDYWQNKVNRFTMTEVTAGFRNSQLVDTGIITKYAYHYLKTVFNKVEVQKGSVTANFRKILGVQSVDETKKREKHSHHAIDATILTLIPTAAQRDKMLELFYTIQEKKHLNENTATLEHELDKERQKCRLAGNISDIVPLIEDTILINHIAKDQTLTPAHKRKRVRGKIVPKRDSNGNILFEKNTDGTFKLDKLGHKIPKAKEWITGDSIRGQLHEETFYGAITQGKKDDNRKLLRNENGAIIIDDKVLYVVRKELKYRKTDKDKGFKNWEELKKAIVDKDLFNIIKEQFKQNDGTYLSFKDSCEKGIYMFKKNKEGKLDYSEECKVNKIRHIRCKTSITNPLPIKQQTYLSDKPYKQYFYAGMGDLCVMCKYESIDQSMKEYRIWSLFDVSKNRKLSLDDIPKAITSKRNAAITLHLTQQIKKGDMLLIYKESEVLTDFDSATLSQRLYTVKGFENDGNRIILQKHINAKDLDKGKPIISYDEMPEKIRCGINTIKFLIKDHDFYLTPQGLVFRTDL